MKIRGVILAFLAMVVFFTCYACANEPEPEPVSTAAPVMVPYLNKTINEVDYGRTDATDGYPEEIGQDGEETGQASDDLHEGTPGAVLTNAGRVEGGETMPELVGAVSDDIPEPSGESDESAGGTEDPVLTPLGVFTITFYCPGPCCCGEWATGCTASGVLATEWHTIATGERFPFGTRLYIDGLGYFTVEDRGVDDNTIDVFVNSHDEALNYGLQYMDVYLVN